MTTFKNKALEALKAIAIVILVTLLLSSCTKYKYNVTYEKCNGQTGSLISDYIQWNGDEKILYANGVTYNVCSYNYTSTEVTN